MNLAASPWFGISFLDVLAGPLFLTSVSHCTSTGARHSKPDRAAALASKALGGAGPPCSRDSSSSRGFLSNALEGNPPWASRCASHGGDELGQHLRACCIRLLSVPNQSTNRLTNPSIHESINSSIHQLSNPTPINPFIHESLNQSTNHSVSQSVNQSINRPVERTNNQAN